MANCEIGLYGLGVMGKSLAFNLIRNGFQTAVYSHGEKSRKGFVDAPPKESNWEMFDSEAAFVAGLKKPRIIFLMVTAGAAVDRVLDSLLGIVDPGDVIIDGGNSYYEDTSRRVAKAAEKGVEFMGVGVSGGERGALEGPCMMAGGSEKGWALAKPYLQKIAAPAPDGTPCCEYVGPEGAGHYVKMVHNGIEYAIMQQISDIYGLMRDGKGMTAPEIGDVFASWRTGPLESYLIDITTCVLRKQDDDGAPLVDKILDVARQKGTGCWTMLEATKRGVYAPSISEALFSRYHSENKAERAEMAAALPTSGSGRVILTEQQLHNALYAAIVCSYVQGINLIAKASKENNWNIDLPLSVGLWRNGCIIRSVLLTKLMSALKEDKPLLLTEELSDIRALEPDLRQVSAQAITAGIPAPSITSALVYYDMCRKERMSVNMVQGLRDCFGAHTYERIDRPGTFHSLWEE